MRVGFIVDNVELLKSASRIRKELCLAHLERYRIGFVMLRRMKSF